MLDLRIGGECADCVICTASREGRELTEQDLARYVAEGRIEVVEIEPGILAVRPMMAGGRR